MATATLNGFNVGTDASVTISDQFGDVFPAEALAHLTEFDSESEDVEIKIVPITLGGVPIYQTIWSGIRGRMTFARVNGSFEGMIVNLMDLYYDLGVIPMMAITQTVLNRDLTTDQYLFTGVQLVRPRFGNFRATKEVDMMLEFRAQRIVLLGGVTPFLSGIVGAF